MKNLVPSSFRTVALCLFFLLSSTFVFSQATISSNGSSGSVTISNTQIVNSYHVASLEWYNPNYFTNKIICRDGFSPAVGDKVLIIQMTGDSVGLWQFDTVVASGTPFQVSNIYRPFDTLSKIQVISVPQYSSLHVTATGKMTASPWNGSTGGILTFMVRDTFKIDSGGICNVNGLGYLPLQGGGRFGTGGAGGAGGAGGSVNQAGGDSLLVNPADNGAGGGGDGGLYGRNGHGGATAADTFSNCPDCSAGINVATNTSNLNGGITRSLLVMGGGSSGGDGGTGGTGGGGGGGGNLTAGSSGGAGGAGGSGGSGASGGGLIIFSAGYLVVPHHDTVFAATGNAGTAGQTGGTGGRGGNGGNGTNCDYGGGGAGAIGGDGGNGGNGGGGGIVYALLFHVSPNFDSTTYQSNGGAGGAGGAGGTGGAGGAPGNTTGMPCGSGAVVQAPNGADGNDGLTGNPGNDGNGGAGGNAGGGGGATGLVVDCSSNPLGNSTPDNNIAGWQCWQYVENQEGAIEAATYGGDGNYSFTFGAPIIIGGINGHDYVMTVIDGNGCTATFEKFYSMADPGPPSIWSLLVTPPCYRVDNGRINVSIAEFSGYPSACSQDGYYMYLTNSSGDTVGTFSPQSYIYWSNTIDVDTLASGTYTLSAICDYCPNPQVFTQDIIVPQPAVTIVATIDSPTCINPTGGSISIDQQGSSCYYTLYSWTDAGGNTIGTGSSVSNLGPGVYTFSARNDTSIYCADGHGCSSTFSYTLPNVASSSYSTADTAICSGSFYQQGFSYYYMSGTYTDTLMGASATGCDSIVTVNLTVLDPISALSVYPQYAGDNCGAVYLDGSDYIVGGDFNYTYNDVPDVSYCSGNGTDVPYTIYVTDGHGCTGQYNSDLLLDDYVYDLIGTSQTNSSCGSAADGSYTAYVDGVYNYYPECNPSWTLTVQGNTNGYSYSTTGNSIGNSFVLGGLSADTYSYSVTGGNVCSQPTTGSFTIFAGNSVVPGDEYESVCDGGPYFWNGVNYTQSGDYPYTLIGGSAGGCDSTATLHLTVFDPITVSANTQTAGDHCNATYNPSLDNISGGDGNYTFGTSAGTAICAPNIGQDVPYTIYVTDGHGCTGQYTSDLQLVDDAVDFVASATTPTSCPNSSDGSITGNIVDYTGQDCSNTWSLLIQGPANSYTFSSASNVGYYVNLTGIPAGTYSYTISRGNQCSPTITGIYTVTSNNNPVNSYDTATVCAGATFSWNGNTYSLSGDYSYSISGGAVGGCDSVANLHLTILNPISHSISASVCYGHSYQVGAHTYVSSGTYADTLTSVHGCDSVVTLTLTVGQQITNAQSANICYGHSYQVGAHSHNSSGTYTDTVTSASGCDSVVTLTLTVGPQITNAVSASICYGHSYQIGSHSYAVSGTYIDTLTAASGCDSVVSLTLSVGPLIAHNVSANVCYGHSYLFGTHTYSASGTYTDTLTAASGCDSIVTLTLNVGSQNAHALSANVCFGHSYLFGTQTYSASGTYTDTLTSASGCDSIVTLSLTVGQQITNALSANVCYGHTYQVGAHSHNSSGTYTDTLTSASGCDSIVTLTLTVGSAITSIVYDTICQGQSYQLGGTAYSSSGIFADTLTSASGCDSTVTLHLFVNPVSSSNLYDTICQGGAVSFGSHSYSQSGAFSDTLSGVRGCDSIVTLHLWVNPIVTVNLYDTLSRGHAISVAGHSYMQSGIYSDTLSTTHGCDSIIHLYLLVGDSFTFVHLFDTVCQGFSVSLGGHSYTVSGTYVDTLRGSTIDTVVSLNLSIRQAVLTNVYDTICQGSAISVGGHSYSQAGIYVDTLSSRYGCDSIRTLHLAVTVSSVPTVSITVSRGPALNGMQTDTFSATYTNCDNPYYSWFRNVTPLGIHTATTTVTLPVGSTDSILCRVDCHNDCFTTHSYSNSFYSGVGDLLASIVSVNIYPNPTHGTFTVDINAGDISSKDAQIAVKDLLGQEIMNSMMVLHTGENKTMISMGDGTVAGVYIVQLTVNGESLYYRIVLER